MLERCGQDPDLERRHPHQRCLHAHQGDLGRARGGNQPAQRSKISDYIDSNYDLYTRSRADLNQNAYENITESFPYQRLTLKEIGIPYYDVIEVTTENGVFHLELSADEERFPIIIK